MPSWRQLISARGRLARRTAGLRASARTAGHRGYRWLCSHPSPVLAALAALVLLAAALVAVGSAGARHVGAHRSRRAAPAVVVGEMPGRRTATSTTRRNKDGSYTTTIYSAPVNYRAPDGSMHAIDPSLYPINSDGYAWRSGANVFQARLKSASGGDLVELRMGGRVLRMSAQGRVPSPPAAAAHRSRTWAPSPARICATR